MASTVYDIRLRYLMENRASRGLRDLRKEADMAASSTNKLSGMMQKLGAGVAGYVGLMGAKKHLLDFNSGIEQSKIQMAGLMQMNLGGTFNAQMVKANELVGRLQERAKASVGTTKDMVDMASMIAQPVTRAGGSMKDLEDMTAGAVVAARAFGFEADVAARDIDQALSGQYNVTDKFSGKILGSMGYRGEAGRERYKALSEQKKFEVYMAGLKQKAILDMSSAQSSSWAGVMSTLEDTIGMKLGAAGLPLFKAITAEIGRWNAWFDKNPQRIQEFVDKFSRGLIAGFEMVKSAGAFIVRHSDTFLLIGKTMLALKGASVLGGLANSMSGSAGAIGQLLTGARDGGLSLSRLSTAAGPLVAAFSAVYIAAQAFADWIDKRQNESLKNQHSLGSLGLTGIRHMVQAGAGRASGSQQYERAKRDFQTVGLVDAAGRMMSAEGLHQKFKTLDDKTRAGLAGWLGVDSKGFSDDHIAKTMGTALHTAWNQIAQQYPAMFGPAGPNAGQLSEMAAGGKPGKGVDKVDVTINHIEVVSDDPDRFIFDLGRAVDDAVRNPSGAFRSFGRAG